MRGLGRAPAVVSIVFAVASGCGSGEGESPSAPASPAPPAAPPAPSPDVHRIPFGFGGPLFQPESPLRIAPGTRLLIPVMTSYEGLGRDGQGITVLVRTDAPQTVLSVSPGARIRGSGESGLVEVRAPDDAPNRESATYRIWLEEDPAAEWGAGYGADVDDTPLLIVVVEVPAPPPPCETLELGVRVEAGLGAGGIRAPLTFGPLADDFRSGEITLRSDHPETSLTLLSQYRMPYEDLDPESDRARVRFNPVPTAFAFGLALRESGAGFAQTMFLGWFDKLHLRAEAPGCQPAEVYCTDDGRCSSRDPAH